MNQFNQLISQIYQWGAARQIHANSTPTAQVRKAFEEYIELLRDGQLLIMCDAATPEIFDAISDDIGDIAVCLVQVAGTVGFTVEEVCHIFGGCRPTRDERDNARQSRIDIETDITTINDSLLCTWLAASDFEESKSDDAKDELASNLTSTMLVLDMFTMNERVKDVSMLGSLEQAWSEIRNRTGHLRADGVFVKDA